MCIGMDTLVHEKTTCDETRFRDNAVTRMWNNGDKAVIICRELRVPIATVFETIDRLGLPNRRGEWTIANVNTLRQDWADGVGGEEIGLRLGFSKSAIHGHVYRLGLAKRDRWQTGNARVHDDMAAVIKKLHYEGKSILKIRAALNIGKDRVAKVIGPQGDRPRDIMKIRARKQSLAREKYHLPQVINLHTLDLVDGLEESIREAQRCMTRKRPALPSLPAKNPRQCSTMDGPRYKQVQCTGIADDLRSTFCADCRALFTMPRAA
jgi:hypothetical protein